MFAGQISGVEGYTESIATGLLAGIYAAALARGEEPTAGCPARRALGSLVHYITHADAKDFQPANITFDLLEPLEEELRKKVRDKKERHRIVCERALAAFDAWWDAIPLRAGGTSHLGYCVIPCRRWVFPGKVSYALHLCSRFRFACRFNAPGIFSSGHSPGEPI